MTIEEEFDMFLRKRERNNWIYSDTAQIYVRKDSFRFVDDNVFEPCLDIANVQVDEEYQGKGIFSRFLDYVIEKYSNEHNLFVESIQNPAMKHICEKRGFLVINSTDECLNMVLRRKNRKDESA